MSLTIPRLPVWIALLATALAAGCASGPKLYSNQDPAANFSAYRTYNFAPVLGTDRQGYSSLLSQYLKAATAREMEVRGYQKSDNPDLLVNFYVNTKEKIRSQSTPTTGGYYGYRSGYYGAWGGYETTVTQYTEGTLTIDLVDASRDQLVWEGTAVGRVSEDVKENLQPRVDQVVTQIFGQFVQSAGR
jgi:hypothetical protein